ncbi:roadblock/LC7 domain-containing protein [Actinokineospora bangkokensis]|uniref:roadblock/LC7 domain-containing protein n=1 Tax=Actinokineospora bangkokensis TaxID=1193682 RepID=UPI00096B4165
MAQVPSRPGDLGWFLADFVTRVPGAAHALVVSADGLVLASSATLPKGHTQQLAAIVSGLVGLTEAAARALDAGGVVQTSVDMQLGSLFLMGMGQGAHLAVLAAADSDLGVLAYEMGTLVERVGARLTPELRAALTATAQEENDGTST